MKKLKLLVAGLAVAITGVMAGVRPVNAQISCPTGTLHQGSPRDSIAQCNLPDDQANADSKSLFDTVKNALNWVLAILGLVAVVMIIIGGFNYLTSQGDPGKTKKGRDTILYGIIGLVIALLAFAIVNFVLSSVFGSGSTTASNSTQCPSGQTWNGSQCV